MKIVIAAGGTGGHIFPALSVALQWRKQYPDTGLLWIGTTRNRERELCARYGIPIVTLDVIGMNRAVSLQVFKVAAGFARACTRMKSLLKKERPDAVLAFGGYVSAPVLAAARSLDIPYFLHEQNTVAGLVNRFFSGGARCTFLGFTLNGDSRLRGATRLVGTPVRSVTGTFSKEIYPVEFDRKKKTVLICGGSQGALSMNRAIVRQVLGWLENDVQVVWQTGEQGYEEIIAKTAGYKNAFVFPGIPDLYPFYAVARVVVGRAGASTLSEIGYFGLPCVVIPLPWAAENHQWKNAGFVEAQGWGRRVRQDERCGEEVDRAVRGILGDDLLFERMSRKALDFSPVNASSKIVEEIVTILKA